MTKIVGRPKLLVANVCKYTDDVGLKICKLLAKGNYRETAAASVGVKSKTLREWLRRGAKGEEPFASFLLAVETAEAVAESKMLDSIQVHGERDWKATAWVMAAKNNRRWGTKVNIEVQSALARILDTAERVLEPDQYHLLVDALHNEPGL